MAAPFSLLGPLLLPLAPCWQPFPDNPCALQLPCRLILSQLPVESEHQAAPSGTPHGLVERCLQVNTAARRWLGPAGLAPALRCGPCCLEGFLTPRGCRVALRGWPQEERPPGSSAYLLGLCPPAVLPCYNLPAA